MNAIASIAAQLALALPEDFDYSVRPGITHEDFTDLLAEFAVVVEKWARGQHFDNWYDLVDAFAAQFAAHYAEAIGGYVSTREWATAIDAALARVPAEYADGHDVHLPAAALIGLTD